MVFNHEVLFLHLGKTGGTSVSWFLCNTLQPPVFIVAQKGILEKTKPQGYEFLIGGKRHANLPEAQGIVGKYGMKLTDFKLILVMVRNPVDIEFSHYRHLGKQKVMQRAGKLAGNTRLNSRIKAAQGSFQDFALTKFTHYEGQLKDFFVIKNKMPQNLKIIRTEEMNEVIPDLLRPFQKHYKPLPHRNKSDEAARKDLSRKALRNIYTKYRWIYDQGFYELPVDRPENKMTCLLKFFGIQ